MSFDNVLNLAKTGVTGGGADDLDGIDVSDASFVVGSICRVYENNAGTRSVKFYIAEASSGTADGTNIVIPVIPTSYSGSIRWHLYGSSGGSAGIEVVTSEPAVGDMEAGTLYVVVPA